MKTSMRRAALVLVGSTLLASVGVAQDTSPTPAEQMKQWDDVVTQLRAGVDLMKSDASAQLKDSRGRTLAQDLTEHSLQPPMMESLTKLRDEAQAKAANEDEFGKVQEKAASLLIDETTRLLSIQTYWQAYQRLSAHGRILEPWLSGAGDADREAILLHLRMTEKTLVTRYETALTSSETSGLGAELVELTSNATAFYNERRAVLAGQQAGKEGAPPLLTRKRESPCPQPLKVEGDREKPVFAAGNDAPEEFYPEAAKLAEVEGIVVVRVQLSDTGCAQSGEVLTSSGAYDLDEAALEWAERATFLPATKNGKGMASAFSFRVNFDLK